MVKKLDAGEKMYNRAIKDYREEFIDKIIELCTNVRRDNNLRKNEEPWTINGLLKDFGKTIEREKKITYP